MRWVIGFGLAGGKEAAIELALWLARFAPADGDLDVLLGVHVLQRADAYALAQRAMREVAEHHGALDKFADLRVLESEDVVSGLAETCVHDDADALIVGRRSTVRGGGLIRLGAVTRNALRAAAGPIIVVPADLDPTTLGPGPLVVATNLMKDAVSACRFARRLGVRLSRPVVAAHVVGQPEGWGIPGIGDTTLDRMADDLRRDASERLHRWLAEHDLDDLRPVVCQGDTVEELLGLAERSKSPMVVAGSRRLTAIGRLFSTSVGSGLAATAPWPTVIVPPDDEAR